MWQSAHDAAVCRRAVRSPVEERRKPRATASQGSPPQSLAGGSPNRAPAAASSAGDIAELLALINNIETSTRLPMMVSDRAFTNRVMLDMGSNIASEPDESLRRLPGILQVFLRGPLP